MVWQTCIVDHRTAAGVSADLPLDAAWWSTLPDYKVFGALGLGYVIICPVVIWSADLLWRAVDVPSVELAKRLEKRMMRPSNDEEG